MDVVPVVVGGEVVAYAGVDVGVGVVAPVDE